MAGFEDAAGLVQVARNLFGLEVSTVLPVTESFSSTVLRFVASDGNQYVVKQPWAPHKAVREAAALRTLADHPNVPAILDHQERDGNAYLLIEGLDAVPWIAVAESEPTLLIALGRAMRSIHAEGADSFDGDATWHRLLIRNADRYRTAIGPDGTDGASDDVALAEQGRRLLELNLDQVPKSNQAVLVHFDLRPGNILINDDRLVGLIDFESCRGGHGSMDFFKLWQQVAPVVPEAMALVLAGYGSTSQAQEPWMQEAHLEPLMRIYSLYHGLAGLAWCYLRNDFSGDFPEVNRQLIRSGAAWLADAR